MCKHKHRQNLRKDRSTSHHTEVWRLGTTDTHSTAQRQVQRAEMRSAPSCTRYHAFASTIESQSDIYEHEKYCLPCETPPEPQSLLRTISFEDDNVQSTTLSTANTSLPDDEPIETITMPQQTHFEQMITNEISYDNKEMVRLAQPQILQQLKESADVFASSDKGEMLRYHY